MKTFHRYILRHEQVTYREHGHQVRWVKGEGCKVCPKCLTNLEEK
jgi:predicted RecB family nuclease